MFGFAREFPRLRFSAVEPGFSTLRCRPMKPIAELSATEAREVLDVKSIASAMLIRAALPGVIAGDRHGRERGRPARLLGTGVSRRRR